MHLQPDIADHHASILPPVFALLASDSSKSVTERAIYAVDALLDVLDPAIIKPFVTPLIARLITVLEQAPADMHDTTLSCLASAASAVGEAFAPHAGAFVSAC